MNQKTVENQTRGTVLVADDTPTNLDLLSVILTSVGYRVETAADGRLALQAAKENPPDLILLDIDMPEMDGYDVCRKLKVDKRLKAIPVLFISALADMTAKIKAFQAGGVDYITKPFQVEEVLARVETHLKIRSYQIELTEKSRILQKTIHDLRAAQSNLIQAEKMASLGVLTAGIAHEINNPINFIKTSAFALKQDMDDVRRLFDLFDDGNIGQDRGLIERISTVKADISYDLLVPEIAGLVDNISMGVERTEAVVNGLRTYSRPDDVKMKPTVLADLIDTSLVLLKNRYKKKIDIVKKYRGLPPILVQPGRVLQVLINVIGNAFDAFEEDLPNGPPVVDIQTHSEVRDDTDFAVVSITDNGPGISDSVLEKIFDPFFTTKDVGKAVGLGMYISYGIIRDHNGEINISSGNRPGTSVSILLPFEGKKR